MISPNGKPLIENLLCVIEILLDYHPDTDMLKATLLNHLPELNEVDSKELTTLFGKDVTDLVASLKKIRGIKTRNDDRQISAFRKMFVAMAKDVRVVMILLAERLCMMKTLEFFPQQQQTEIARESLYIYAPIAGMLGMFALKTPLEDISFHYLHPDEYRNISEKMIRLEIYRDRVIKNARKRLQGLLKENNIDGTITGRIKGIYSVYRKMQKKQEESIEAVYDIFAIRIVVPAVTDCYTVLGILHEHFVPLPRRFKDYIAVPKPNGYRSLHTTLVGLSGITRRTFPVEVQIRTEDMNLEAEYGIAAHWHYKEKGNSREKSPSLKKREGWIEGLSELESTLSENQDFMRGQSYSELFDRIYALTPGGDIIDLPLGATPIDFAFAVHTDVGLRIKIAKANGKGIPLDYQIKNGDILDIITGKNIEPNQSWLAMCVTAKAKNKLRSFLREKDTTVLIREGKTLLNRHLARFGYPELDQSLALLKNYGGIRRTKKDREDLLLKVGNGSVSPTVIIKGISEEFPEFATLRSPEIKKPAKEQDVQTQPAIIIGGRHNIPYRFAACCHPKTGDELVGFVTRGVHVTLHRSDCKILEKLEMRRLLEAYFEGYEPKQRCVLEIYRGFDRVGFVRDITAVLAKHGVNISNLFFKSRTSFEAVLSIEIEIDGVDQLILLMNELERVEGVFAVKQVRIPESSSRTS